MSEPFRKVTESPSLEVLKKTCGCVFSPGVRIRLASTSCSACPDSSSVRYTSTVHAAVVRRLLLPLQPSKGNYPSSFLSEVKGQVKKSLALWSSSPWQSTMGLSL